MEYFIPAPETSAQDLRKAVSGDPFQHRELAPGRLPSHLVAGLLHTAVLFVSTEHKDICNADRLVFPCTSLPVHRCIRMYLLCKYKLSTNRHHTIRTTLCRTTQALLKKSRWKGLGLV
jgi:hypothetical protein